MLGLGTWERLLGGESEHLNALITRGGDVCGTGCVFCVLTPRGGDAHCLSHTRLEPLHRVSLSLSSHCLHNQLGYGDTQTQRDIDLLDGRMEGGVQCGGGKGRRRKKGRRKRGACEALGRFMACC